MNVIGLKIGPDQLWGVEVAREEKDGPPRLLAYAASELSPPLGPRVDEVPVDRLAPQVTEFLTSSGFESRYVSASVEESQVFTRVIQVPKVKTEELKNAIRWEAEQYIPLSLEEVNLNYQILPADAGTKEGEMDVLLVAAPLRLVEWYTNLFQAAGLIAVGLEPESAAAVRTLLSGEKFSPVTLIVNLGLKTTDLAIVSEGSIRFTRSISVGGEVLVRSVAQNLGFEEQQALEYLKTYGVDPNQLEGKLVKAVEAVLNSIFNEIQRSLTFFTTHRSGQRVKRVSLCGPWAQLPGIVVPFASFLDLDVQLIDPWQKLTIKEGMAARQDLEAVAASFVVPIGLALREV